MSTDKTQQTVTNPFAMRIISDSMLPMFWEDDVVLFDPAIKPRPGDFVMAATGEHESNLRKYVPCGVNAEGGEVFELLPLNEDYPPMRSDVMPITIVGTMVEHRMVYRNSARASAAVAEESIEQLRRASSAPGLK